MKKLQDIINELWGCLINNIEYDYKQATLSLSLFDNENSCNYKVMFLGVISLVWTMEGCEKRIIKDVYPELTSLVIKDISLHTENKWLKYYPLNYNITIEIMDRALVLNANAININDNNYKLKDYTNIDDII